MKKVLTSLLLAFVCLPMAMAQNSAHVFVPVVERACGSFTWIDGQTYSSDTNAVFLKGDTVFVLDLTIVEGTVDTAKVNRISGNCSATFKNKTYYEAGRFIDTLVVGNNCDSVVKIEVTLNGVINDTTYDVSVCDKYVLPWKNDSSRYDTIKTIGSRVLTHTESIGGCMVNTTINLTINRSYKDTLSTPVKNVTGGCYYRLGNRNITDTTKAYYDMVTNSKGCDSLVAIRLVSLTGLQYDTVNFVSCDTSYRWNKTGTIYYADTVVTFVEANADSSCITTNVLDLRIESEKYDTVVTTVCAAYTYSYKQKAPNGSTLLTQEDTITESGFYIYHRDSTLLMEKTNKGCKTYHALDLTIIQPTVHHNDSLYVIDTCDNARNAARQFKFDGQTFGPFTESVADTFLVHRNYGGNNSRYKENQCYDTTVHLKVNIRASTYLEKRVTACDSYVWYEFNPDKVYTESTGTNGSEEKIYDTVIVAKDSVKIYNEDSTEYSWMVTKYDTIAKAMLNSVNCDSIGKLYLTINKSPNVTILGDWMLTPGESTVLRAESDIDNMRYQWYRNGVAVAGAEGRADTLLVETDADADNSSNIDITLIGTKSYSGNNTCADTSWITVTSNTMGIEGANVNVAIYPNPASRVLSVECQEGISQVTLYNNLGQQMIVREGCGNSMQLDLGTIAAGVYTLRVVAVGGAESTHKIIVRK